MKCSNCGSELREDAKFCGKCGTIVTTEPNRLVEPTMPITPDYRPSQSQEDMRRVKQKNIIIVLLSCLVVFVLVDVIVLFGFMSKRAKKEDTTVTSASTEQTSEVKEEEGKESSAATEIVREAPVFTRANCSSIRNTDSEAGQYSVGAVIDGDLQTKWAPQNANRGLGEWIEIIADEPQYVTGIRIANGYPRDQITWERNNRVKECTISFGDGTYLNVTLLDQKDLQTVEFGREVETSSIRITINSLYYGTKWRDVAIAEIVPFNEDNK